MERLINTWTIETITRNHGNIKITVRFYNELDGADELKTNRILKF